VIGRRIARGKYENMEMQTMLPKNGPNYILA
jgi:hypothetical protein